MRENTINGIEIPKGMTLEDPANRKIAPYTKFDVEGSFSIYELILTDTQQTLTVKLYQCITVTSWFYESKFSLH